MSAAFMRLPSADGYTLPVLRCPDGGRADAAEPMSEMYG
jgi:hypothetical protein